MENSTGTSWSCSSFEGWALSVFLERFIITVGVASWLLFWKKVSPLVAILVEFQLYPSSIWQPNIWLFLKWLASGLCTKLLDHYLKMFTLTFLWDRLLIFDHSLFLPFFSISGTNVMHLSDLWNSITQNSSFNITLEEAIFKLAWLRLLG